MVATPDHLHFAVSLLAIKLGKHVYCEKPLTHTIAEARSLAQAARQSNVATQMGNQGNAFEGVRLIQEWIEDGAIGPVRRSPLLDQQAPMSHGHRPSPGNAAGAGRTRLGPMAGAGGLAALSSGVSALHVAKLVGFRFAPWATWPAT